VTATTAGAPGRWRFDPVPVVLLAGFGLLPILLEDASLQNVLTLAMIWTFWAASLNVIWGYAGQFSMAQVALGGLSAYTFVVLVEKSGWDVLPAVAVGVLATVAVSVVIGLLCLRLEGFGFAIMTLAFALAGVGLASSLEITGRTSGISVPGEWAVIDIGPVHWELSGQDGGFTVFMFVVFLLLTTAFRALLRSREGRGLLAIREDPLLAQSLGLSNRRYRLLAFALGAVVAAVAGVFQAEYYRFIYPSLFSFGTLVNVIVVLVLGGRGHLFGPLIGGIIYAVLTTGLEIGGDWESAVFGALVILVTIFARHGLAYYLGRAERGLVAAAVDPAARRRLVGQLRGLVARAGRQPADRQPVGEPASASGPPSPDVRVPAEPPAVGDVLLELRGVSKAFGGAQASRDLSFEIRQNEIVGIIGPNGAGKTTAFNLASGFMAPDDGTVLWRGRDVTRTPAFRRARDGMVRTFQQPRTFPALSVRENLVIAAEHGPSGTEAAGGVRRRLSVDEVLDMFGLRGLAGRAASDLSYGFAKRLGVAMAVATNPLLVLLDEPAAGLNTQDIRLLRADLLALRAAGVTVCVIEHHMDLVMEVCDRVIVLDAGELIFAGTPDEVLNDPKVIDAYLGVSA
jgi:branched-chain amino acid transport system permease protein